jgi:hypothetical protein
VSRPSHISVPEVLALLDADSRQQVFAAVPREDVIALLLLGETVRQVLIVERAKGRWTLPGTRTQTAWTYPSERPRVTEGPLGIAQLSITQSASPGDRYPETGWTAITGVAAQDAEIVSVRSDIDSFAAAVSPDGIFLALLRAPWRSRPRITVVTHEQQRIEVGPIAETPAGNP